MIPFDFEYYKPATVAEACETYRTLQEQKKSVVYYSGGTEFITLARVNQISADAVIDLKGIPEVQVLEMQGDQFIVGSAVTLNQIAESRLFPLLAQTVRGVADHNSRNKITIGGNLGSRLSYREGVLPLLLADCKVRVAGGMKGEGERVVSLSDVFDKQLNLEQGEFLLQILVDKEYLDLPYVHLKKTKQSKVDYPLVSVAALVKDKEIRMAFSGICEYPFRLGEIEEVVNNTTFARKEQLKQVVGKLPAAILDDLHGSAGYREFVFRNVVQETIDALEWAQK
ncbi:FAD binding domain-containing protein [Ammoniphilus resinae]|uniref:CO/xanthine dehydrogenase FAD-binding subunit n=1 Tax=Ammoniphilus resinae TaxID=861532 RepID=A0ABS4GPE3_9BACL|nr:FAD binding domain-containing protein [Ammoniphilus resinae]MBP1932126.1 CO/xanthine dehydrogenase FAD-binding subunit [Ammoniphilus resinae]